ncbi:integrase, catalytic region, zinc finger, CCHC-type containing protein [Tanacetum coccineum]
MSSNPSNRQIAQAQYDMVKTYRCRWEREAIVGIEFQDEHDFCLEGGSRSVLFTDQSGARAEGNAIRNNGNQIRCYNCKGLGHLARNYTVRPRRRDAAYLQTYLLIAQKEET